MCLVLWHPLDFVIERLSVLWTWPPFIGALLRLVWTAHSAPTPPASMRKKSISSHPHCSDVTWPFTRSATRKKKQHRRSYSNSVWSLLFLDFLFENLVISQWFKSHWTKLYPFSIHFLSLKSGQPHLGEKILLMVRQVWFFNRLTTHALWTHSNKLTLLCINYFIRE